MPDISLVTINILNDLSLWEQRGVLIVEQLSELIPDLVALQEVNLKGKTSTAHWLAEALNQKLEDKLGDTPYQVFLCPKTGVYEKKEGIAILSRFPVKHHESLDLLSQNRVAQIARIRINDRYLLLMNGHFFWKPGVSKERQQQVELILDYLDTQPVDQPVLVCGDFNGTPGTPAINRMLEYFDSAHFVANKQEPIFTSPTPLPKPTHVKIRTQIQRILKMRPDDDAEWRGTLDYIFVDPRLQTLNCQVVLNKPADYNEEIYPSDHFGLWATIKVTE